MRTYKKISYKVRCKNGVYKMINSGIDSVNKPLGYVNGVAIKR